MALTRLCPFCLEPLSECVCEIEEAADITVAPDAGSGLYQIGTPGDFHGAEGLTVLRTAAEGAMEEREAAPPYRGVVIIEWPAPVNSGSPYACISGCLVTITDAVTGKPIRTCMSADITVHADAESLVTADLTLFADEDGEPVLDGGPVPGRDEILTGVFPFLVSEMRVRGKGE